MFRTGSDAELRETILYPARDVGVRVEPGLVELLLRELGDTTTPAGDGILRYEAGSRCWRTHSGAPGSNDTAAL